MTYYLVKLGIHDWPKRSDFCRKELRIAAETPERAMELAVIEAQAQWPGGKAKAFDCVADRNQGAAIEPPPPYLGVQAPESVVIDGVQVTRRPRLNLRAGT